MVVLVGAHVREDWSLERHGAWPTSTIASFVDLEDARSFVDADSSCSELVYIDQSPCLCVWHGLANRLMLSDIRNSR